MCTPPHISERIQSHLNPNACVHGQGKAGFGVLIWGRKYLSMWLQLTFLTRRPVIHALLKNPESNTECITSIIYLGGRWESILRDLVLGMAPVDSLSAQDGVISTCLVESSSWLDTFDSDGLFPVSCEVLLPLVPVGAFTAQNGVISTCLLESSGWLNTVGWTDLFLVAADGCLFSLTPLDSLHAHDGVRSTCLLASNCWLDTLGKVLFSLGKAPTLDGLVSLVLLAWTLWACGTAADLYGAGSGRVILWHEVFPINKTISFIIQRLDYLVSRLKVKFNQDSS